MSRDPISFLVKNSKMLRRRASKSITEVKESFTLGPPLRLTDIDCQPPSDETQEEEGDKENSVNNQNVSAVKQVGHNNGAVMQEDTPIKQPHVAFTHPCNPPDCSSKKKLAPPEPWGQINTGNYGPPLNDELLIGSRNLHKLCVIGRGGSSKVFKVFCNDGNLYALKEIYMKYLPPEIKAAFINEIKLLKKLRGKPQIIILYDYTWDQSEGILRLLLEHGEMDLGELICSRQESQPLRSDPLLLMFLWQQMLNSVKIIHDEGIIHNDLKPENFVCCGMQLKLIDFGIANKLEEEHTSIERDIRCGTANYMSPESIMTHDNEEYFKIGRPSDVWSLGCILYQMVFHRTPFEHVAGKLQKFHAITDPSFEINFPLLIGKRPCDVIKLCLQRNPKARPSIEELLKHDFLSSHFI